MIELETGNALLDRFARELDGRAAIDVGDLRPDLSRATPEDVEHAQLAWMNRVAGEYRGAVVVAELYAVLLELAAPYPALACVQRIAADELRHVALCARVVGWLGGRDAFDLDLAGQRVPSGGGSPAARALELVAHELCVVEDESVHTLTAYVRAAEDAAVRRVFEDILRDEVRHAASGRALRTLLEHAYAAELGGARDGLEARLDAQRHRLRAESLANAVGGPGRALGGRLDRDDLVRVYSGQLSR